MRASRVYVQLCEPRPSLSVPLRGLSTFIMEVLSRRSAGQQQGVGHRLSCKPWGWLPATHLQTVQGVMGEMHGQQHQAQQQKAEQKRAVAAHLNRHALQKSGSGQPEQTETGRKNEQVAQTETQLNPGLTSDQRWLNEAHSPAEARPG